MAKINNQKVLEALSLMFPHAQCELNHQTPFQLLIAVMLSAQTTDASVNKVTPALFRRYPEPSDFAHASLEEVESFIKTLGLFRSKAKHLIEASQKLLSDFGGKVPNTREQLMTLPGVGRKTANVVLSVAFHEPALAVDTHVERVTKRLGFVANKATPWDVEEALMKQFAKEKWGALHHQLIFLGRYQCVARKPLCETCRLQSECRYFQKLVKHQSKNPI